MRLYVTHPKFSSCAPLMTFHSPSHTPSEHESAPPQPAPNLPPNTPLHQHPFSSHPKQTVHPYIALTTEVIHQHDAQQCVNKPPKHTTNLKDIFDTLDVNLPSHIRQMFSQYQVDKSSMERFRVSDMDPFSRYTTAYPQQLDVNRVTSPVPNGTSWGETHSNKYAYGASSTVAATCGDSMVSSQDNCNTVAFVPEQRYNVSTFGYAQDVENDLLGVGTQFDSDPYSDDAKLTCIRSASLEG